MTDKPLINESEFVYKTIDAEIKLVELEIEKTEKSIKKLKEKINNLEERKEKLIEASKIIEKAMPPQIEVFNLGAAD